MGVDGLEIERKYLLRGRPDIPDGAEVWRIQQGYLAQSSDVEDDWTGSADVPRVGRVRRTTMPDGSVRCTHTIKHGAGLVRREIERAIPEHVFDRAWPQTIGRRLRKIRHRVPEGPLTWEIDEFEDIPLWLAEVEMTSPDTEVRLPLWLEPFIDREVTSEPSYTNSAIAAQRIKGWSP